MTRQVVKEGVKIRGITISMEIYYFIVFMTHSFLRPTETEVFALRHRDIIEKHNPRRLEIKVQGKIERWHQTLKNRILLENYFFPADLEAQIEAFVDHYNHQR